MKRIVLITTGLLLSAQIQAHDRDGCSQSDVEGDYVMYQNSVALANLHTGRCEIKIQRGQASGTCAFNVTSNGAVVPGFKGAVSGPVIINSNCSANVELDFSPAPNVTVKSFFGLQFSPDKQSFMGQWTNNFGLLGTSSGIRFSPSIPASPASNKHDEQDRHRQPGH